MARHTEVVETLAISIFQIQSDLFQFLPGLPMSVTLSCSRDLFEPTRPKILCAVPDGIFHDTKEV